MNKRYLAGAVMALGMMAASVPAMAQPLFFIFSNGPAKATGSVEFAYVGNSLAPGFYLPELSNITATVTGASAGNGTFQPGDFAMAILSNGTGTNLDLTRNLVGQSGFGASTSSDFNVFRASPAAPTGYIYYTVRTDGGSGETLSLSYLSSTSPGGPMPEVGSGLLAGLVAFGTLAFSRLRKAKALA